MVQVVSYFLFVGVSILDIRDNAFDEYRDPVDSGHGSNGCSEDIYDDSRTSTGR
jgi:hypothetical protein